VHSEVTGASGEMGIRGTVPRHSHSGSAQFAGLFDDLNNFGELETRIAALPTEGLRGAAFEVFAEAWLATQRLPQARTIWPADSVPSEIQRQLHLPLKDMGVDGVFETALDERVCYQAKFRSGRPALNWTEITTFFGLADFAAERLLFTNCDDVSAIAEQRRDAVFVRGSDLDGLTAADFNAIKSWLAGAAVLIPKKTPKPHQEKAIRDILHAFDSKSRATALMACGTGKTLIALWTAEKLAARTILVLVPSLALVRQVLHEWLHETNWPKESFRYLCVCSDESVDRGNDELLVQPSDVDFKVTTASEKVRQFLTRESTDVRIIFSTYQSSAVVAHAAKNLPAFEFAVFDEAHKTAGREGAKFGVALADDRIRIARRLFMTATPRHYDIEARDKSGDAKLVYSMDTPEIYGAVVHSISFSAAARLGIISDYKVVISVVTSEMVTNELIRRGTVLINGEEIKAAQVANQIALRSAVEKHGVRKIFTFHSRIAAAESFTSARAEGIREQLPGFDCFFVKGAMPAAYREKLLREFAAADRAVMSNARCLTEGVDLPAVDMVGFLSPRRSLVDIVQATGRAMRRSAGKEFGYVLVPLYVEQMRGESVEDAVVRSKFDEVWRVLQSLKEHDDLLAQIISDMRIQRGQTGGYDDSRFRERVEILGPTISLENLRRFISSACIDALGESWFERYGELVAYKQEFGHCDVPKRSVKKRKLANWIVQQRVSRNAGTLSRDKIELLDAVGFKWHPGGHRWRENYLELVAFKDRFGHCRITQDWKEDKRLAKWVSTQRVRRKRGALSGDRVQLLNKLGFDWRIDVGTWDQRFGQLCEFKQRFDHTRVHVKWSENPKLGAWVVDQRHRRRRNKLRSEFERSLNEIGFEWELSQENPVEWDRMFTKLRHFKELNGHCQIPYDTQDATLAEWCQNQRRRFRSGRLKEDRRVRLDEIGFEWSPPTAVDKWDQMLRQLSDHREQTGSCIFHNCDARSKPLRSWCSRQRRLRRLDLLSDERRSKLDALGFQWTPRQKTSASLVARGSAIARRAWDEMFYELLEFFKIHGHYDVPQRWKPNAELAGWVAAQRAAYRQHKLPEELVQRLNTLGFRWEPFAGRWDDMYEALRQFHSQQGHTRVPQQWPHNRSLAHWVAVQRRGKKLGRISEDRIGKLELLGFEWNPLPSGGRGLRPQAWETMFTQLKQFHAENGHTNIPQQFKGNRKLGWWITTQRRNRRENKLSAEQIARLESVGFLWTPIAVGRPRSAKARGVGPPRLERWDEMLTALKEYKTQHGDCRVPQRFKDNRRLAEWVSQQRISRNKSSLDPERERILTAMGLDWNPIATKWDAMFRSLEEYKKRFGHTNVPQKSREYPELAAWVANERYDKKKNKPISRTRAARLDALGFTWEFNPAFTWEDMFNALIEFKSVYGHCNVPQHWRENKRLGKWVNTQRTSCKRGKLPADRLQKLNEIGFAWHLMPTNKRLVPLNAGRSR
jgi:superfamily II DNA or RNA helicase